MATLAKVHARSTGIPAALQQCSRKQNTRSHWIYTLPLATMKLSLSLSLIFAASAYAAVPQLTPDNYSELTAGKTVFLKFFAPW